MHEEGATGLAELYQDVGPGLLAYLRRRLGDRHVAEDVLQETFCQAARRLERLAEAASPRAWLFTIARNLAATMRRRRGPAVELTVEPPAVEPTADARLDALRAAIAELPEAMRETLELRLRDELSYEEIAAVLGLPIGTVRSRLHHAVQRLRTTMQTEE